MVLHTCLFFFSRFPRPLRTSMRQPKQLVYIYIYTILQISLGTKKTRHGDISHIRQPCYILPSWFFRIQQKQLMHRARMKICAPGFRRTENCMSFRLSGSQTKKFHWYGYQLSHTCLRRLAQQELRLHQHLISTIIVKDIFSFLHSQGVLFESIQPFSLRNHISWKSPARRFLPRNIYLTRLQTCAPKHPRNLWIPIANGCWLPAPATQRLKLLPTLWAKAKRSPKLQVRRSLRRRLRRFQRLLQPLLQKTKAERSPRRSIQAQRKLLWKSFLSYLLPSLVVLQLNILKGFWVSGPETVLAGFLDFPTTKACRWEAFPWGKGEEAQGKQFKVQTYGVKQFKGSPFKTVWSRWRESKEKADAISKMPESEAKRRRYV